ncbi:MAG: HlyD family efflux transporter periplasmic adaptor subunit [Bacteroidota bacterium]
MKKLRKPLLSLGLILLGVLCFALMKNRTAEEETVLKINPPTVATFLATPKATPFMLEVTGTLQAKNRVEVYSEVQGVLLPQNNPFKEGHVFRKGERLLQIDGREHQAQLLSNKSNLISQITAMLPDMELEFPVAAKKWEAYVQNFTMRGPLQPLPETSSDQEKFFVTGKGIVQTYYNVKNLQARASKYTLIAPFKGMVTESNVTTGTLVRSGQKLGAYIDPSIFELQLAVPETAAQHIEIGKTVTLATLTNDQHFNGTIRRINSKVDQATRTINAIVTVVHPQLKDGQYLKARITGKPIADAVKLKGNLLQENDHVYILKDSTLVLHKVVPVNYEEDSVLVKGLQPNMRVLNEVLAKAHPGMSVNF